MAADPRSDSDTRHSRYLRSRGPTRILNAPHVVAIDGYAARLLVWVLGGRENVHQQAVRAGMAPRVVADLDEVLGGLEVVADRWTGDVEGRAGGSEFGTTVAEPGTDGTPSTPTDEVLTTRQVAQMLDCSTRYVTKIADQLGGTKHGHGYLFPRSRVLAHLEERSAA